MTLQPKTNRNNEPKFLRWAGSKTQILPYIATLANPVRRYLEPFCGSAAVFFGVRPSSAVLSDANGLLIETFLSVRDDPNQVFDRLQTMSWSRDGYYAIRELGIASDDSIELAARFIFLNANCFNGLFRTNRSGQFNVPYGGERAGACPSLARLLTASERLKSATIECGDFEQAVRKHLLPEDLVYLDPPFAVGNYRSFHQYRYDDFGRHDIERLRELLKWIDSNGARFILSYASSAESTLLAEGWKSITVKRLVNIAGFKAHRRSYEEVLVTNG